MNLKSDRKTNRTQPNVEYLRKIVSLNKKKSKVAVVVENCLII